MQFFLFFGVFLSYIQLLIGNELHAIHSILVIISVKTFLILCAKID